MEIVLNDTEIRIIGSLIEKSLTTPDYYPLSLNALLNACNQKSNRDPVVSYDEATMGDALDDLVQKGLVWESTVGRVPKYEERFTRERDFVARESSVLCVLFLRGAQTVGELRGRTARMHAFENLAAVQETLNDLEEWGYIRQLPRMPGHKESRYTHLLCAEPEGNGSALLEPAAEPSPETPDRMEMVEAEVAALRRELENLQDMFHAFKKQFE